VIKNANNYTLSQNAGTLPNMQDAMLDWFQKLTFIRIVKKVVNFNLVEVEEFDSFQGVRQPLSAQQLQMKPEGQRAWKCEMIHSFPDLVLKPDDQIKFNGVKYRVKEKTDDTEYGYIEYHIVQDFQQC